MVVPTIQATSAHTAQLTAPRTTPREDSIDHAGIPAQQTANPAGDGDDNHHEQRLHGGAAVVLHLLEGIDIQTGGAKHSV